MSRLDLTGLGKTVIETMPVIRQAIVASSLSIRDQNAFERKILAIRKQILNNLRTLAEKRNIPGVTETYMPSFSTRTIVYKGLLLATQVGTFYQDLAQPADHVGAGDGAPALFDQHLPVLEAGASVSLPGPQRGNQHRPRQRQLDVCPPPVDGIRPDRRRT